MRRSMCGIERAPKIPWLAASSLVAVSMPLLPGHVNWKHLQRSGTLERVLFFLDLPAEVRSRMEEKIGRFTTNIVLQNHDVAIWTGERVWD